jgi:hypothetical protein
MELWIPRIIMTVSLFALEEHFAKIDRICTGTWNSNLRKTDQGMDLVFQQCVEAREECALYEQTADEVKERYLRIERSLDERPVVIHTDTFNLLCTRRLLKRMMLFGLYSPYFIMKPLFETFKDLEASNGLPLYKLVKGVVDLSLQCNCESKPPPRVGGTESSGGIMCSDAQDVMDDDPALMKDHFEKLSNDSHFADIWSTLRYGCM